MTFPGYSSLLGAEQLKDVETPEDYRRWHAHVVEDRLGEVWDSDVMVTARVNHGRWVADCFWCSTGMLIRPDWGIACCGECGAFYRRGMVTCPNDAEDIEAVLCRRVKRENQNWAQPETVADLRRESLTRGVA